MTTCLICKAPVSDQEFKERYEELLKQGITPMLVPICKKCREKDRA